MPSLRTMVVFVVAATLAALAVVLVGRRAAEPSEAVAARPAVALISQTRVDALAGVARRIYNEEVYGSPNASAFRVISRLPGLIRGLETGNPRLGRRTLDQLPVRHAVHELVTRRGRIALDVGLKFVVAGQRRPFHAPSGRYLGRIEISIQDVIGFVRLFHRLTGAEIVVRGLHGHAKSSLASVLRRPLPTDGPVSVYNHKYYVRSFDRVGFAGEPLRVWILDRIG